MITESVITEAVSPVDGSAALRVLTADLVDDAGLFPPEELSLPAALARYRADRRAGHPVLSGRFVCPSTRVPELRARLGPADRVELSVVVAGTLTAVAELAHQLDGDPRLRLASVEVAIADLVTSTAMAALAGRPDRVVGFAEISWGRDVAEQLEVLAPLGWAAKVRCGGVRAELFPTAAALAGFLIAATDRGIPFKATAGLHHAVSHHDPVTGFTHYGFLNLLLAVHRARQRASLEEVVAVLLDREAPSLVGRARALTLVEARSIRSSLRSYGSCSTAAPVADLERLELLPSLVPAGPTSSPGGSHG